MSFLTDYFNIDPSSSGEVAVCCPFHGDTRPSASVNVDKDVFHCLACDASGNSHQVYARLHNISFTEARRVLKLVDQDTDDELETLARQHKTIMKLKQYEKLGISDEVASELTLGWDGDRIIFPILVEETYIGERAYKVDRTPDEVKVIGTKGLKGSFIIPHDVWKGDERPTLLCAGEKDMAIARTMGLNAITFTGGEGAFPRLFKGMFRDRQIVVAYDNDSKGRNASREIAAQLKEVGAEVYILDLSDVCREKGEDVHDFFVKYGRTADEMESRMQTAITVTEEIVEEYKLSKYPKKSLAEGERVIGRSVSSDISVVSQYNRVYSAPVYYELYKVGEASKSCQMEQGESREWALDEDNLSDVLWLVGSGVNEAKQKAHMQKLVGLAKESGIRYHVLERQPLYMYSVTDDVKEDYELDAQQQVKDIVMYSLKPLKVGERQRIYYRMYPHPLSEQEVVGIIFDAELSESDVNAFRVDAEHIRLLRPFQDVEGTVYEKMDTFSDQVKAVAGAATTNRLAWFTDMYFHSVLHIRDPYRPDRRIRGALDIMVVGDTRTGKSHTAKTLRELYDLGIFTSLKSATVAGIIGGQENTQNGGRLKVGVLPRNHGRAVIMEEFSAMGSELASKLTDIRSSGMVRIERIAGTLTAPAVLRMLTISNQLPENGRTKALREYPNGVIPLQKLIGASEDMARYDMFLLVPTSDFIRPDAETPARIFTDEEYQARTRWAWSRKWDDIEYEDGVKQLLIDKQNYLQGKYKSAYNFIGVEGWQKILRLAVAVAAMCVSTDETYEKVIIRKEHIEWVSDFIDREYGSKVFRLHTVAEEERAYQVVDEPGVKSLEALSVYASILLEELRRQSQVSSQTLKTLSGLDVEKFTGAINILAKFRMVTFDGNNIIPSLRFRESMEQLDSRKARELGT